MPADERSEDWVGILDGYKPADNYNPPEDEKELVSSLSRKWEESWQYRIAWDRQWELNRLYLKGHQLIVRNRTTNEVFRLPQDDQHRLIAVNNVLRPTSRSLLGKLTRVVPTCVVIPPTDDLDDMQGAETGDALLYYHRRASHLDTMYIDMYRDVITFGTGVGRIWWDKDAGYDVMTCPECKYEERGNEQHPCPECSQELELRREEQDRRIQSAGQAWSELPGTEGEVFEPQEELDTEEIPEPPMLEPGRSGEIRCEVIDPRDFFVDPSATSISEAQWVCYRVALPVPEVRRRFPDKGRYIDIDSGIFVEQHVSVLQNVANMRSDMRQLEDHVYLYEWHEMPTDSHPTGRIIYVANDIILDKAESPYYDKLQRHPFFTFFWERNKGEFWGESWIDQAWPIQRELNILLTQMREHRELTNRPKLLASLNAGVPVDEIDTTAGQIIFYNPVAPPPQYLQLPEMPSYVQAEMERMKGDIRSEASVTEQEVGLTSSDASGRYAAIIEAEASQQVGPVLRYNSQEWIELHRAILILAQEFYDADRRWTIAGSDRPMTWAFDKMNLQPGWDIDVQEDDSMSNNHAVRLQQALAIRQGAPELFVDPRTGAPDPKIFKQMARLKAPHVGPNRNAAEHARAAAIPLMMQAGERYEPRPYDDPDIFAEELRAWLSSAGQQADRQLHDQIVALWQQYRQNSQAAQQAQQQPGAPATAGQGNGPQAGPGAGALSETGPQQAQSDAQAIVQNADQQAEFAANANQPQES
jgi:hypothetical protein